MKKKAKTIAIIALFTLLMTKASIVLAMSVDNLVKLKDALFDTCVSEITISQGINITNDEGLVINKDREVVLDLNGKTLSM